MLLDPQSRIARAYGATVTPHMYIIDASGMLVYKGGIDSIPSSNVADMPRPSSMSASALDEVLAGKPVSRRLDPALWLHAEVRQQRLNCVRWTVVIPRVHPCG